MKGLCMYYSARKKENKFKAQRTRHCKAGGHPTASISHHSRGPSLLQAREGAHTHPVSVSAVLGL